MCSFPFFGTYTLLHVFMTIFLLYSCTSCNKQQTFAFTPISRFLFSYSADVSLSNQVFVRAHQVNSVFDACMRASLEADEKRMKWSVRKAEILIQDSNYGMGAEWQSDSRSTDLPFL